jgi:2'-hydroxyisoflavone reductase
MPRALVVGGTRFVGRHAVAEFREHGYDVTIFNRGRSANPFADAADVEQVTGDRTVEADVRSVADAVDYDVVVDVVAYHPDEVRVAVDAFADADAYVYVSTGSVYDDPPVPAREGEAPLLPCDPDQEDDESVETYGNRKAECDRAVFDAAADGVRAMAVRPMLVYGPHDYSGRFPYWVEQVRTRDRVLVPGDGGSLLHRSYVGDVASALRAVAEEGTAGRAYNAADRRLVTLADSLERVADALGTDVEVVTASARELDAHDLEPAAFPLYTPDPFVVGTERLASLGWTSTPLADTYERTVGDHAKHDRTDDDVGPDGDALDAALSALD